MAISEMRGDWGTIERVIEAGLAESGYSIEAVDKLGGIAAWPGAEDEEIGLSEWTVRAPADTEDVQVQVSNFELLRAPVDMPEIGPVLALDDVAGWKTAAFVPLTELPPRQPRRSRAERGNGRLHGATASVPLQ